MAKGQETTARNPKTAVAYYRTSSAANVGEDKDSQRRQQAAVASYAKRNGITIAAEFYDAAVSGADHISDRPGFSALLDRVAGNGVGVVLVEDASRFARDLIVQMTGHELLKRLGVELVPANAPDHFREDTPTAVLVRQVLGAISQFEKAQLVQKLKGARERKRADTGRCEGRKPVPDAVVKEARRLARKSPKTGERRSLREIASALAKAGHTVLVSGEPSGKPYGPESIKRMLSGK
jgi:DNA invertase Pin-like site-specific DNA recombinase